MKSNRPDFESIFRWTPGVSVLLGPDFTIVAVNDGLLKATGLQREEIVGRHHFEVFPENPYDPTLDGERNVRASLERVLKTGKPDKMDIQRYDVQKPAGERGEYEVRYWDPFNFPVLDASGRVTHIVHQAEEVTELVLLRQGNAEQTAALAEAQKLDLAVEIAQMGIFEIDLLTDAVTVNEAGRAIYGWAGTETTFAAVQGYFHPEDKAEAMEEVGRALDPSGPGGFEVERRIFRTDGQERWIRVRGKAFFEGGRAVRLIGAYLDFTEQKRADEELRKSEALYRAIAANLPNGAVFLVDRELRYRLADGEALREAGFKPEDFEGKTLKESLPSELADVHEAHYRAALAGETFRGEHEAHGRDYVSHGVPLRGPDGAVRAALAVSYDITERKRAERELRSSEERYRTLFDAMDEGFCVIEMLYHEGGKPSDYRFLEVNPAFERQSGLKDAVGKRMRELKPEHEEFWFEIYGRVAETGEPVRFERQGRALEDHWFSLYAFRLGEPDRRRVAVLFTDITEQKDLERSLRERAHELADADRRKDEFLAMLAHELRNPLSAIHSAVRVAQSPDIAGHLPQMLEIIERQSKNLARLIDDLLDVSRITQGKVELKREVVDVTSIINRAAGAVRPLVELKRHAFSFQHGFSGMLVDADPTRLEQVVGNLLTNAAKYTEPGGRIIVTASAEGAEVVIAVRDTGVGIPPEMLPKVFDLFTQVDRSLDRSEGGLGIGLSLVKRLVEMHGGTIEAESEVGRGSEFIVRLPLVAEPAKADVPTDGAAQVSGAGRRLLIVDDNADTARLIARLLRSAGFLVRLCHDGREALDAAREFRPEVLLLDIGLPGMDGFEVARRLRQEEWCRHSLIVGVSGYGDEEARVRGREAGFDHHLVKPVDIEAVTRLISDR